MSPFAQIARLFQGSSTNRKILRAAAAVTAGGIFVKIVATLKEVSVAGVYGRSDAMDAFLAANLIPGLLINLISESMNQALVPTLIRVREREGHDRAQQLLSNSMVSICVLLAAGSLAMALAARWFFPLIASHFAPAKFDLSVQLFYGLLPIVLITGIATNCTAVLNTFDRFSWPSIAPVTVPLGIMLGAWFLSGRMGPWAMVVGSVSGSLIQAVWVAWMMDTHGYKFRLRWHGMDEATRDVANQYWPVLISSIVSSSGLLVDQSMAASLSAGSVSSLAYASRFVSVVLTLLGGAVSAAVVPYFSRMIAVEDWRNCRHTLRTWVWLTAAVSLPIALLLMLGSRTIVRITYQHGAFGPSDTAVVAPVLVMYAIQIPFFATSRILYRFIVSMRRNDLILYCGIINLILDIGLNLLLMRYFQVAGIALATSLWMITTFLFLWYWAERLLREATAATAAGTAA